MQAEAAAAAEAERRRAAAAMHAAANAESTAPAKKSISFFGLKSKVQETEGADASTKKQGFFSGMFGRK